MENEGRSVQTQQRHIMSEQEKQEIQAVIDRLRQLRRKLGNEDANEVGACGALLEIAMLERIEWPELTTVVSWPQQ